MYTKLALSEVTIQPSLEDSLVREIRVVFRTVVDDKMLDLEKSTPRLHFVSY
ncbi:hypothetical protein PM082_006001 [Marasmius tenuissimus]|nr:hypothetical protein PM082_006001 [Marasmius tenuissimus]